MDKFFIHVIRTLRERVKKIPAILLHRSQNNPQVVNIWSDHDLWIVLIHQPTPMNLNWFKVSTTLV